MLGVLIMWRVWLKRADLISLISVPPLWQSITETNTFLFFFLFLFSLQFNFVGKLLGPRGNSLKRLQEDTLTKMSILGKGSMRDKEKVTPSLAVCPFLWRLRCPPFFLLSLSFSVSLFHSGPANSSTLWCDGSVHLPHILYIHMLTIPISSYASH